VLEIQGGRRFRSTLKKAGDDLTDLKAAHKDAADIAAQASAALTPVVTGRLRKTVRSAGTKTAGIIRAGNNTRVPYAPAIHWGWYGRGITANPFLSNGAQDSEGRWIRVYQNYLNDALDQVKGY
jgi:hypothetical protein